MRWQVSACAQRAQRQGQNALQRVHSACCPRCRPEPTKHCTLACPAAAAANEQVEDAEEGAAALHAVYERLLKVGPWPAGTPDCGAPAPARPPLPFPDHLVKLACPCCPPPPPGPQIVLEDVRASGEATAQEKRWGAVLDGATWPEVLRRLVLTRAGEEEPYL